VPDTVEFQSNGSTASGYLVTPSDTPSPGVIVVQEWWGVDEALKEMADRLGAAGFVALAPDLYHGEVAGHDEMDKAGRLMQSLPLDRAARDMGAAVDYLLGNGDVRGDGVGVVGFCMGGMLAMYLGAIEGPKVKALVTFYGFPQGDDEPDWSNLTAVVRGHMAENDDFYGPEAARSLEQRLKAMGKDVQFTVHAGTGHAFMNPRNALGTRNEEKDAEIWPQVVDFLHAELG
jgi:carboxymethylenebutenolidase